ncbi:MAG: type II toxin-antitoxin system Phd/YefM family antitoxin [Pseudomonadota bacterium]|nr:type II toxin-antitoxin system Phd/YefM family antitoxin [Pseudomonadota bacterium]
MGESIVSLSELKSEASQLLARIRKSGEAIVLTQNGTATALQPASTRLGLYRLKPLASCCK